LFALQPADDFGGCQHAPLGRHSLDPARHSRRDPDRGGGLTERVCKQLDDGGIGLAVTGAGLDRYLQAVAMLTDYGRSPSAGLHLQRNADPCVIQMNPGRQVRRDRIAL
jgi:hypothetical protein